MNIFLILLVSLFGFSIGILLFSFALFTRLVRVLHDHYPDEWLHAGKPVGFLWRPTEYRSWHLFDQFEKRICDQLGGVRLDLSEARMGKAGSRYRAGFWPLSRRRFDLEPSLLPVLPFNALDDELASITLVSGLVSTQSSGRLTVDLSPSRTFLLFC